MFKKYYGLIKQDLFNDIRNERESLIYSIHTALIGTSVVKGCIEHE